jgi:hypothetical protein
MLTSPKHWSRDKVMPGLPTFVGTKIAGWLEWNVGKYAGGKNKMLLIHRTSYHCFSMFWDWLLNGSSMAECWDWYSVFELHSHVNWWIDLNGIGLKLSNAWVHGREW